MFAASILSEEPDRRIVKQPLLSFSHANLIRRLIHPHVSVKERLRQLLLSVLNG